MTIKGPWDAKTTPLGRRQNELAQALPKQLQAREMPLKQINQGGAENHERQPKEQTRSKKPNRNLHSDREGLPVNNAGEPILPEQQSETGGP